LVCSPEYSNAVGRLNDNVKNKWSEISNEINAFVEKKLTEMEVFIESHNDTFWEDESICPACGCKVDGFSTNIMKGDKI